MSQTTRRDFLKTSAAAAAAGTIPYIFTGENAYAYNFSSPNERPVVGCIGTGSRWGGVGPNAMQLGDCVAVCDVDARHANRARDRVKQIQSRKGKAGDAQVFEDYQKILDMKEVDVVTIVTPDHWHTKIAIEAMKAGKDVYCEKPLTLTIDEGKQICKVAKETKRVFQVGTQQRSEMGLRFLQAVAMVRDGRVPGLHEVSCAIGGAPKSGPIPKVDAPKELNWEKWLGQTPVVDYRQAGKKTRCHYEFRWWYEYSGGKMTDWGAHHVDIAQWAIDQNGDGQGPTKITPKMAKHPVPYKDGHPQDDTQYNAATEFLVECEFAKGIKLIIRHDTRNGIMFTGESTRFFVNRGGINGAPVVALKDNPLPDGLMQKIYKGKKPGGGNAHMRNFFECIKDRTDPISDVYTHHRAMTTCHLANIAIRLGRELKWDSVKEEIVGDKEANTWLAREQRKGYEIKA